MARRRGAAGAGVARSALFALLSIAVTVAPVLAFTQREALLLLGASIDTTDELNWSINTDTCSWTGITCDADGEVTTIDLEDQGLVGQLPTDSTVWSALGSVTNIVLEGNSISGILPSAMSQLSNLQYLSLGGNSLTGSLPSSWGELHNLRGLDLSNNTVSGELPGAWGNLTSLNALDLSGNLLNGSYPISWNGLNLTSLSLAGNTGLCSSNAGPANPVGTYYGACSSASPQLPDINPLYNRTSPPPPMLSPPPPPILLSPPPPSILSPPPPPVPSPPLLTSPSPVAASPPPPGPLLPPASPSPVPVLPPASPPPPVPSPSTVPPPSPVPSPVSPTPAPSPISPMPAPSPASPTPAPAPTAPPPPPPSPPATPDRPSSEAQIVVQVLGTTSDDFATNITQHDGVKAIWAELGNVPTSWVAVVAHQVPSRRRQLLQTGSAVQLRSIVYTNNPSSLAQAVDKAYGDGTLAQQFAELGLMLVNGTLQVSYVSSGDDSNTNVGAIVGGSVGGAVGLIVLAGGAYFIHRRRRRNAAGGEKGDTNFTSTNATFEEDVEAKGGRSSSGSDLGGELYGKEGKAAAGQWSNPMYGSAAEAAKPSNPLFDGSDDDASPSAAAAGQEKAAPSEFVNPAFDGLDTPKGEKGQPANPLYDTQSSQLSGPGGEDHVYEAKKGAAAAAGDFVNPAFATDNQKPSSQEPEGANPLYDSDDSSQLSGPDNTSARYGGEISSHPIGEMVRSGKLTVHSPTATEGTNPLFGAEKDDASSNPMFEK